MVEKDTYEAWTSRVEKELGDKDISTLNWKGPTGLEFKAYYPISPVKKFPTLHSREKMEWNEGYEWDVFESIKVNTLKQANQQATNALLSGATGILFHWPAPEPEEIRQLLSGIDLEYIQLGMEIPPDMWRSCAIAIRGEIDKGQTPVEKCKGFFQSDLSGCSDGVDLAHSLNTLVEQAAELEGILPGFRFGALNMAFLGSAGLSSDWELAVGLASYAYQLENSTSKNEVHTQITLSVGSDYFSELAKFRIAPYLFQLIAEKEGNDAKHYVLATMNQTYISHLDTHTNILRLGTSAMSAVIGGCSGLVLMPFSADPDENPDFVSRVTRNVQLVLLHESGIAGVQDAAAGSGFIEELSFRLAEQAWDNFIRIQKEGGILNFLRSGQIDQMILKAKAAILAEVNSGKRFFLGVNHYSKPGEIAKISDIKEGIYTPLMASSAVNKNMEKEVSNG